MTGHVLMPWLVVEEREDGTPIRLELLQQSIGQIDKPCTLNLVAEDGSGTRRKVHVLWTPSTWKREVV